MRRLALLGLFLLPASAAGQSLEVVPDQPRANVGDVLTLHLTVRLPEGQQLLDLAPRTLLAPPEGMRMVSIDTLRRVRDGEYRGDVRMAFYRIGKQPVPTLALLYRPDPKLPADTLVHAPLSIEIEPVLPAGNQEIRDIRPLLILGGPIWGPLAILLVIVAAGGFWLWRRGRPKEARRIAAPEPIPAGPFDAALARLAALEAASLVSGNGIVPLFDSVAEVIRTALVEAGALPHQGFTTPEVPTRLPPALAAGDLAGRCETLLGDADLVKFARVRPDRDAASTHVNRARSLLEAWRDAAGRVDAVR
jgi:hypothetical protein